MKFNLVNDDKLQIIISKEDLERREMRKWDLMPNNPEAQRMFQEILEEARDVCGFDVGQNTQLMIEAYPMTGESMLITVTKVNGKSKLPFGLDLESVGQSLLEDLWDEEDYPDVSFEESVYRFANLEDLIQAASLIQPFYDGESQLVRYKDAYYLILWETEWLADGGAAVLSEFSDFVHITGSFFQEHGEMLMPENALAILEKL